MTTPIIVAVAPNGARRTRADHPALPMTSGEIAREAAACREAGAVLLHLHVRDADGRHSLGPDLYRDAIAAVRREAGPELIVQMTTEAVGRFTAAEQMASVRAVRPEAVSVAVRELVPDPASEREAAAFLDECARGGMMIQYIVYSAEDLQRHDQLVRRGVIPPRNSSVLFVLGRYTAGQVSNPSELSVFLEGPPRREPWFVCAFGPLEAECAVAAAVRGGHARVGFENNLLLSDGRVARDNAALVTQLATAVAPVGRRPASHAEALATLLGGGGA